MILAYGWGTSGFGNSCGIWEVLRVQGRKVRQLPISGRFPGYSEIWCLGIYSGAFSGDGRRLVAGADDGTVGMWSTQTRKSLWMQTALKRKDNQTAAWAIACSPNGKLVASGHADSTVRLWDVARGKPVRVLRGHAKDICRVAFSPDANILASGSADGLIKLWNVRAGEELRVLKLQHGAVCSMAIAPNGATLAAGYWDGTIAPWRIQ
jgi:WD40 repeat protein